jgi:hypothetical protein
VTTSTEAEFELRSTETATFECSLDGDAFSACESPVRLRGLAVGTHTFEVRAVDVAANVDPSPAYASWTVVNPPPPPDTTPPDTSITEAPASGPDRSVTLTFVADEPGSTFECSLDATSFAPCESPLTVDTLELGSHRFDVRAVDASGNVDPSPATHTWSVLPLCPTTTLVVTANADSWLEQNSPTNTKGTDSILKVKSQGRADNFRAVVGFGVPSVPEGCRIERATLRLYNDGARTGRSIAVDLTTTAWSERTVTWANQPARSDPGLAAVAASASGYMTWDVSALLRHTRPSAAAIGFVLRDTVEDGSGFEQSFFAREKGERPPQLVLTMAAG